MRRYFINSELKRSTAVLLVFMFLFLSLTAFLLRIQYDSLKEDYIESMGAVAARVIEKAPALEKEIIPLITKEISKEDAVRGKAFLNRYGVSKRLENSLFPYISRTAAKSKWAMLFVFFAMTAALLILNYVQHGFFYERVRRLTLGAKKVVEGEYDLCIDENMEGDFSKLALSFNSMRQVIRNKMDELKKEKQFLVNLLSDLSHQLKTPLSSMMVYNDIMLSKALSEEQREAFLQSNQNQLNRMEWLVRSILKLARLDAKAIELNQEEQSVNETVHEAVDTLLGKAAEGNIRILLHEKAEVTFRHDRLWLEEALINIIKNCIEHTPDDGQIDIALEENPIYIRITITDTGEGISEEDLPNIFKRFYKGKNPKKGDSVGIGLALAKSIVELHNGMLEARSRVRTGSSFTMTFLKY